MEPSQTPPTEPINPIIAPLQPTAPPPQPEPSAISPPPVPGVVMSNSVISDIQPAVTGSVVAPAPTGGVAQDYVSNPFLNTINGLILLLKTNPVSSLLNGLVGMLIIFGIYLLSLILAFAVKSPSLSFALTIIGFLSYVIPVGAAYAIAGASGRGEKITTSEAMGKSFSKILPMLGLMIIMVVLGSLLTLLLIIPGVIFFSRASLALLVMFEEDLGPIASLKRSLSLTKHHVNEMLGSVFAGALLGGAYSLLISASIVAPLVGRYHDLKMLQETGAEKPKTHWLNYLYIPGIVLFIVPFVLLIAFTYHDIQQKAKLTNEFNSQSSGYNNTDTSSNSSYNFSN